MDYALSLRCGHGSSTFSQVLTSTRPKTAMISARSWTKPHVFFIKDSCPPTSQLSNFFRGPSKALRSLKLGNHALGSPVQVLAQKRFSQGKGDGKSATIMTRSAQSTFRASLALACALGIFCFAAMFVLSPRKAKAFFPLLSTGGRSQQPRMSASDISPLSAKFVLNQFMEGVKLLSSPTSASELAPKDDDPVNIEAKKRALRKMKEGKISPDMILDQMRSEVEVYSKCGEAQKLDSDLSLLEIMILQGKYKEASNSPFLTVKDGPTDLRHHLYMGIVHTLLDNREIAKVAWKNFVDLGFNEESGSGIPNPGAGGTP